MWNDFSAYREAKGLLFISRMTKTVEIYFEFLCRATCLLIFQDNNSIYDNLK